MTTNQINLRKVKEDERHNRATEAEERRHNIETETYTAEHYVRSDTAALQQAWASASQAETAKGQLAINAINAETQQYVAETGRLTYQESVRHNVEYENELNRHNTATEIEAQRHNTAEESIGRTQAAAATKQAEASMLNAKTNVARAAEEAVMDVIQIKNINADTAYKKSQTEVNNAKALQTYADVELTTAKTRQIDQGITSQVKKDARDDRYLELAEYEAYLNGLKTSDSLKKEKKPTGVVTFIKDTWNRVIN